MQHDPPSDQSAHPTVVIAGVVVAIVEAGEVVECAKIKVWSMFIFNSIECVIGNVWMKHVSGKILIGSVALLCVLKRHC